MKMYRARDTGNFTTPEEFMHRRGYAPAHNSDEIDTTKSADVISVIRNALSIKSGREGFITDIFSCAVVT